MVCGLYIRTNTAGKTAFYGGFRRTLRYNMPFSCIIISTYPRQTTPLNLPGYHHMVHVCRYLGGVYRVPCHFVSVVCTPTLTHLDLTTIFVRSINFPLLFSSNRYSSNRFFVRFHRLTSCSRLSSCSVRLSMSGRATPSCPTSRSSSRIGPCDL